MIVVVVVVGVGAVVVDVVAVVGVVVVVDVDVADRRAPPQQRGAAKRVDPPPFRFVYRTRTRA